ncbi:MAG: hypothetical protein LUG64_04820 [Clostridiales bacterium]|nr:hypothetical protein [Clostridiales bacterium]
MCELLKKAPKKKIIFYQLTALCILNPGLRDAILSIIWRTAQKPPDSGGIFWLNPFWIYPVTILSSNGKADPYELL